MKNGGSAQVYCIDTDRRDDSKSFELFEKISAGLGHDGQEKERENWLSVGPSRLPFDLDIDLHIRERHETLSGRVKLPPSPSTSSFDTVGHVTPDAAQLCSDLDSFIARELDVTPIETVRIRKDFCAMINEKAKGKEKPSFEESANILEGIILAASKIGEALRKEMSR